MKPKADLLQGTLDRQIIKTLSLGPLHGYGINQRIRHLSDELLEVEEGSLYPAVYRIELRGWISSGQQTTHRRGRELGSARPGDREGQKSSLRR